MTKAPIACSLTSDAVVDRVAEWRELLSSTVVKVERRKSGTTLWLDRIATLPRVSDLAERERVCCPFFEFAIEVSGDQTFLHIDVPTEAEPILSDLMALLPGASSESLIVRDM